MTLPLLSQDSKENSADQRRLTYFYLAAEKQKALGNYNAMAELLRHCLEIDSSHPAANFELSTLYLAINQDSIGLKMLKSAVTNDPKNPWYLESLASTYLGMRQPDEAIPVLEEMGRLQTKRTDVQAQLFQLYKSGGRTQDAIKALDRIQTLQGNSARIAAQKYALYLDLGDTVQAFNQLKDLCKEFPYDATSLLLLGDQYLTIDQPDSAKSVYDKVEAIDPQNPTLQTSRMQYYLAKGDTVAFRQMRDSIALEEKADLNLRITAVGSIARDGLQDSTQRQHAESMFAMLLAPAKPPIPMLQLYMAYKAYTLGQDNTQLIPIMERILDVEPSDMETLQQMLSYYASKNEYIKVGELCQKALVYHPGELAFHYFLALSLAQQEKKQEAVNALQTAVRQADENSRPSVLGDVYALLGDIEHELGHEKASFAAYDSCLVYNPENVQCLNNYAYYLSLKNEQIEKAEQMSYRTIKAEPNNRTYLDTYAWILFMQNDFTTSRIYIDRVVDPQKADSVLLADNELNSVLLEHAGDIYFQSGKVDEALRYWQLAKQKDPSNALLNKKIKKRKYIKK